jgi:hypothetical protein
MRSELAEMVARMRARFLAEAPEFYTYVPPVKLLSPPDFYFGWGDGLDREQFVARVRDEHAKHATEYPELVGPVWSPDEIVLKLGRILVLYMVRLPMGEDTRFGMADLRSADGRQFTAGELLWAVYRATAKDVMAGPHQIFEGLELVSALGTTSGDLPVWVPVYRMGLGS